MGTFFARSAGNIFSQTAMILKAKKISAYIADGT